MVVVGENQFGGIVKIDGGTLEIGSEFVYLDVMLDVLMCCSQLKVHGCYERFVGGNVSAKLYGSDTLTQYKYNKFRARAVEMEFLKPVWAR